MSVQFIDLRENALKNGVIFGIDVNHDFAGLAEIVERIKTRIPAFYRTYDRNTREWEVAMQYAETLQDIVPPILPGYAHRDEPLKDLVNMTLQYQIKKHTFPILEAEFSLGASKKYEDGMSGAYAGCDKFPGEPFKFFFPHDVLWDWFEVRNQTPTKEEMKQTEDRLRFLSKDPLEVLGVTMQTPEEEIRRKWRALIMLHHPDKGGDTEVFLNIQRSLKMLTDPNEMRRLKRAQVMEKLAGSVGQNVGSVHQPKVRPVLFRPPFQQGIIRVSCEPVLDRFIINMIYEWRM